MAVYLISYDLDKPGQDYPRLVKELELLGAVRVLYSEWIFRSTSSPVEIRDWLQSFIDSNDMLLVVALSEAAWTGLMVTNDTFKQALAA